MQHRMRTMFLHSRKHGLSVSQMAALLLIHRRGTSSVSDIGDDLEITNPAASQLLERLVQQGLIARSEDPNDRRLKQISISRHGEAILREGLHARQRWLESLAECMSADEQEQVAAALNILIEKVHRVEHEATLEP
ncbi:MAG: MarR family winged helix-turn-helix transcriptional regulator [Anaerolineae bacterium]